MHSSMRDDRLAVLLPVTSKRTAPDLSEGPDAQTSAAGPVLAGLQRLADSLIVSNPALQDDTATSSAVFVLLGIDSDDDVLMLQQKAMLRCFEAVGVTAEVMVFSEADRAGHPPGAVCYLWGLLAAAAVKKGYNLAVLLGDDTEVEPVGWPHQVLEAFAAQPSLMLMLLNDSSDPGFPSFPVLRVDRHLELIGGQLLPECFINQGGDPFLAALYHRWHGAVAMLPDVTVYNHIGGVQRADKPYTTPRYSRYSVSKETMLQQLRLWTPTIERAMTAAASASGDCSIESAGGLSTCTAAAGECPASKPASNCGPGLLRVCNACLEPCGPDGGCEDAASNLEEPSNGIMMLEVPDSGSGSGKGPAFSALLEGHGSSTDRSDSVAGLWTTLGAAAAATPALLDGAAGCGSSGMTDSSGTGAQCPASDASVIGWSRQLAVDVLVPTARVDVELLQGIADAVLSHPSPPGADLSLILVVDQPPSALSQEQLSWLQQLQTRWLHRVRVRFNDANMGASATRNRALQESLAEYVILWDDDIKPSPGCLAAYVQAFREHPEALGFAGPSYIPKDPNKLWPCAVHNADVLFFWDAAEDWKIAKYMPWAVTANVALVNTAALFDLRFPKTGGGEDIDYCLKVTGGRLVPVPQASVHHPLWNGGRRCYSRFFGWALGDGALIPMYPTLCYSSAPNSAEACCTLVLLAATAIAASVVLAAATRAYLAALRLYQLLICLSSGVIQSIITPGVLSCRPALAKGWDTVDACLAPSAGGSISDSVSFMESGGATAMIVAGVSAAAAVAWAWGPALLAAMVAYKLADMMLDVARAFTAERVSKHPCSSWWLRMAAASEASLIKTWSEFGRIWGHVIRGELGQGVVCRRFDWFGGLCAEVVVGEQRRAALRFLLCAVAAAAAGLGAFSAVAE